MPSTVTHTYFVQDVYQKLPVSIREILLHEKEQLPIFAQSMDPLFFYNITNLKKGKRIRQFGEYFHEHFTQDFFINLIEYIKYNDYSQNASIMAFLYGMVCHYILDSTMHPYIVYKTGIFDKNNKETYKYKQKHAQMENFIDNYMIWAREKKTPYHIRYDSFATFLKPFSPSLQEVIDYSFKETFDVHNMSRFYYRAICQMKLFFRLFRNDYLGFKKIGYKTIDFFTPKNAFQMEVISYHMKPIDRWNYLNLEKNKWNHPANPKEIHHESFFELYSSALNKAVSLIEQIHHYLVDNESIDLKKLFPNLSYLTGKDCNKKLELKYFEF